VTEWRSTAAVSGASLNHHWQCQHLPSLPRGLPPLRSRPSARARTGNHPDPPRRSALTAPNREKCRLRQRLRAPARSVRAGCCPHRGARVPAGGAGREGGDLPLEGGPEVHRTCGAPPPPSPRWQSWRSIRSWRSGSVRCPAALSSSSPRSQGEAKVVALRSNAVWGPRAPPLRPRGPAQAGSTAPDPASLNAPRLSAAASGRAGGSQRWLRRRSGWA